MKRILITVMTLLLAAAMSSSVAMERNKNDKSIENLWTEYRKASEQDRVQKMAEILEEIKIEALSERAAWDYYSACTEYVDVKSRRNWKERDTLQKQMREEIAAYDEPLLTYLLNRRTLMREELLESVSDMKEQLAARRNEDVYDGMGGFVNLAVKQLIDNDYEYVLWDLFGLTVWDKASLRDNVYALLREEAGDTYPKAGIAEYSYVTKTVAESERESRLKALADKYEGTALALLPISSLLDIELRKNLHTGTSEYFLDLKERLESYEHERNMYRSGIDRLIVMDLQNFGIMLRHLESKSVLVTVKDGNAEVALRNLDKVKVVIARNGKDVYETVLHNPDRHFYVLDTLSFALPVLDDGDYRIICYDGQDEIGQCRYPKFTLSVASRVNKDGIGVYVADYKTGKPLEKVDMALYKGDRKVAEKKDVMLDGFTALPGELASAMDKKSSGYYLVCSFAGEDGTVRRSYDKFISDNRSFDRSEASSMSAVVMLDRSAFNPGETVRFKAVAYETFSDGAMAVSPSGERLNVSLRDHLGGILSEKELVTNEFGSVAGEFLLDGIKRNGNHTIDVHYGNRFIGRAVMTVDEFVLPTFEVGFEEPDDTFMPGDTIAVSGKVTSYSGHSLASADVEAKVMLGQRLVAEQKLEIAADGSFTVRFADVSDDSYHMYDVEIRVTDLTGETKAFHYRQYVARNPIVSAVVENPAEGSFSIPSEGRSLGTLLSDETARVALSVSYSYGTPCKGLPLKYALMRKDGVVRKGDALSGDTVEIDFAGLESGLYKFVVDLSLNGLRSGNIERKTEIQIVKVRDGDVFIDEDFENLFRIVNEESPELQFGAGRGPVWAVVELYGDMGQRLKTESLYLEKGEMRTLMYEYEPEFPDALIMNVLYFRESKCHTYTHTWRRQRKGECLPLKFERFEDLAAPGSTCSVVIRTKPGAEILASVFDVATEQVRANRWTKVTGRDIRVSAVWMDGVPGVDGAGTFMLGNMFDDYDSGYDFDVSMLGDMVVGYGSGMRMKATRNLVSVESEEASEDAVLFQDAGNPSESLIRDDFSASLTFEPFLHPSEDGTVKLVFNASDKISTFAVSAFAHDKSMNNDVIRREMLVTLPVKVSVVQPQYLYEGDRYVLKASLSNNSGADMKGLVMCAAYDGDGNEGVGPMLSDDMEVIVPAGGSVSVPFEISVSEGVEKLGLKVVFNGAPCPEGPDKAVTDVSVSDGVFVTVPVYPASQILTESHSGVLFHGMSEEELMLSLKGRFVNVSSAGADYSSVTLMDMLRDALPLTVEAEGRDVISQSEAMSVNLLAAGLRSTDGSSVREYVDAAKSAVSKILACVNEDGGFGWFEGMKSSPIVTAVVLERFAGLRDRRLLDVVSEEYGEDALDAFDEAVVSAVRYLDSAYFSDPDRPVWYGCISLWQYLNVRSMYVGVPFDEQAARKAAGSKGYNEFRKAVREHLVPKNRERQSDGAVLRKVRMVRIIDALETSEQGMELAHAWGVSSDRKLRKSMKTELESLKEYAVEHPSGGMYYPNAVLPWRGLLESEAYAHAMICDLFNNLADDEELGDGLAAIADGIRLWIMLQKETQHWESDPGFVEAMTSVYDGSDTVKDTRVIILSKRYIKPFDSIKASGNGFRVSVKYYVEETAEGKKTMLKELSDGDILHVGDKVVARYLVWSEDNRSFVCLSAPRPACLRPENQLSGWSGGWLRPLSYSNYAISPYAYREVKTDRTLYWIDVFPEEDSIMEETFFVTQEGRFSLPVAEIESLYAPHYRANDDFFGSLISN